MATEQQKMKGILKLKSNQFAVVEFDGPLREPVPDDVELTSLGKLDTEGITKVLTKMLEKTGDKQLVYFTHVSFVRAWEYSTEKSSN